MTCPLGRPTVSLRNMTPQQLLTAAQEVIDYATDAELIKNEVGNLSIVDPDRGYIGFVDLRTGEVNTFMNG